jgi:hypothetical protein
MQFTMPNGIYNLQASLHRRANACSCLFIQQSTDWIPNPGFLPLDLYCSFKLEIFSGSRGQGDQMCL